MAPTSAPLVLAILSVTAVVALGLSHVAGGWMPIQNPKDDRMVSLANYAVAVYNSEKSKSLTLEGVDKAEKQIVAGVNYRLVLSAKDGAAAVAVSSYTAVVYVPLGANKSIKLTSFVKN